MKIKTLLISLIIMLIGSNTYADTNILHIKNISSDKKIVCRILSVKKIPYDTQPT